MNKKCIINLVTSNAWYPSGQKRLCESLKKVGFDGDVLTWVNESSINCPKHSDSPYAFKPYAFMEAKKRGYKLIQWLDASFWAIKPLNDMFDFLENHGWLMQNNDNNAGVWCSDNALKTLGITREEGFGIQLFSAGGLGLNLEHPKSIAFLDQWYEKANDGVSFVGSWTNRNKEVSQDSRVMGHRHDMTAASVIARNLGMDYIGNIYFAYFQWYEKYKVDPNWNLDTVCLLLQGM